VKCGATRTVGTSNGSPSPDGLFRIFSPAFFVVIVCDAVVADKGRIQQRNTVTDVETQSRH